MAGILPSELAPKHRVIADRVERAIYDAVHREIELAKEEIIQTAVNEFQTKVRAIVARITLQASDFYSVHNMGHELVIHVKIDNGERKP